MTCIRTVLAGVLLSAISNGCVQVDEENQPVDCAQAVIEYPGIEDFIRRTQNIPESDPITHEQIIEVSHLHLDNAAGLCTLNDLVCMEDIAYLKLPYGEIESLKPISHLTHLVNVELPVNNLHSLDGLFDEETEPELMGLDISWNHIDNIDILENAKQLVALWAGHNQIEDISCLAGLTRLDDVHLAFNRISDISPLAANEGLAGGGTTVSLAGNPLDASDCPAIETLRARGVQVTHDIPECP